MAETLEEVFYSAYSNITATIIVRLPQFWNSGRNI